MMNIRLLLTSSLVGTSLIACNGGGSAPAPISATSTTPVTQSVSTAGQVAGQPFTPQLTQSLLQATGLASAPSLTLPFSIGNGAATVSNVPPTGVATFSSIGPVVQGERSPLSSTISGATAIIYSAFTPTVNQTVAATPFTCTFVFANAPAANANYHLAFFNGSNWLPDTLHVGTVTGNNVVFSGAIANAIVLSAGTSYGFVLYSLPQNLDSATPSPSATASASATATPTSSSGFGTSGVFNIATSGTPTTLSGSIFGNTATFTPPNSSPTSGGGSIGYSVTITPPANVTPPSGSDVHTVYGYAQFTPTGNSYPVFASGSTVTASFAVPATPAGTLQAGTYSVAYSGDGTTWLKGLGNTTISGNTATMTYTSSATTSLSASTNYYLALYK